MKTSVWGTRKINLGRKHGKRLWFLAVLLVVVLAGNLFRGQLKDSFYFLSGPLQKPLWQAGHKIDKTLKGFFKAEVLEENELLRRENQRLLSELSRLSETERENETLRRALELDLQKEFRLLPAEVSSGGISRDALLLDKGRRDGVQEGMPVISEEKILYGFVGEVYERYSVLYLLSHPESRVNVTLPDRMIEAEVSGEGGKAILGLIPRTYDLKEGELLVTKSFAGKYPQGLLVGFVGEIKEDDLSPFRKARVSLFSEATPQKLFILLDF